jgi:2-(1,2-epoxy-1,2-dihydrophenyl)acetyl-CoA isomerase
MTESVLIKERKDNLLFLRMNRPDRLNAINGDLMDELLQATQEAADDNSIRAVVLTGEGRSFCAGGDVRDGAKPKRKPSEENPADPRQAMIDSQFERTQASYLLHTMPKPTIALVRGAAMGAGMSLALACDYRIISDTAVFRSAFVNNALSGDYGIGYFLSKALGAPKAMELLMLSQKLNADDINALGLATRLVADDQLMEEGLAFAKKLASGPTVAYAGVKQNIVASGTLELKDYLRIESENQVACTFTKDIREAGKAFIEKRAPVFKGE